MNTRFLHLKHLYNIRKRVIEDYWNNPYDWRLLQIQFAIEPFDEFVKIALPLTCNIKWKLKLGKQYLIAKRIKKIKNIFKLWRVYGI